MNEDKSSRYHRQKRYYTAASVAWSIGVLVLALWSGFSLRLRDGALASAGALGFPSLGIVTAFYLAGLGALHEAGSLALGFLGGLRLERRYGLSMQSPARWAIDQLKALAISFLLGWVAVTLIYWTMRVTPDYWWLLAGGLFALLLAVLANLAPVLLVPIFYRIRPLARESLRLRLMALADRAGTRVIGVYEWGLGDKTRKANAALTGLGATRRILVSDTMLAEYSDDEIEVVLAHELAHHVHGDIWKGLLFESGLILAGFFLGAQLLTSLVVPLGLRGIDDIAGLPVLLLAAGLVSAAMLPVAHALSRAHERRADRFALDLTKNPGAFISAMKRLGAQNLAEERPSRIVQWLFYSHPPLAERIAVARQRL
ncbi:MAG: M48 family metalloprotease [Vicinamibacterales bacterium]